MAGKGIAAVALFQFFYRLERLLRPPDLRLENPAPGPLSYRLESFKARHHTDWNLTMAATVLVMAP